MYYCLCGRDFSLLKKQDLVEYMASGVKPREHYRIGLEHEQFVFDLRTGKPLAYDGSPGIKQLLETLSARFGWAPVYEHGRVIALKKGGQSVTLEPAGQIELSGSPHATIAEMAGEHMAYTEELRSAGQELGVDYLQLGVHPTWGRDDMHWMPKERYQIMREYLPTRGGLGVDMMTRTSGAQINLDFESEADMVQKMRIMIALQPIMIALFANSRIVDGRDSGYVSYRAHIWSDTDPDRCGILPFVFDSDMGFERYVDYMLDVPMFLIYRDGKMINMAGQSFRRFLNGTLPENKFHQASLEDWEVHLGTAFPEVRLKKYLELRGPDSVSAPLLYALAAFWVGLVYAPDILAQAGDLIQGWTVSDHIAFRETVTVKGLDAPVPQSQQTIRDFAPSVIALAREGLQQLDGQSSGLFYLDLLQDRLAAP
ncbi:MAG: glutamate--cysteine ligase [Micavibrio sp.]|nr:glutamate--cysteine ligase [Micavibrio sp.]|tara:strand:- start:6438 stop:7715 length:1278 start_codon:yes stop_codon:yes gene_type:complete